MTKRAATCLLLFCTGVLATATASAETWEYKSYRKGPGGNYEKDRFVNGTISVKEKDGKAWFHLSAGNPGICYRGELPATVTRTDELTTIEVTQPIPGCEEFRYYIKNDGSGGYKETRTGDRWFKSRFDHGLTPAK